MIPEDQLWPVNETWELHCGKNEFSTLDRFQEAINKRYGEARDVADFAKKAQLLNYELMRPMFEAFQAHKSIATGIIQWMLNSALPNMYWQLYDSYLMPNGAFYGTKKACEPLHLLYNYGQHSVALSMIIFTLFPITGHSSESLISTRRRSLIKLFHINIDAASASELIRLPDKSGSFGYLFSGSAIDK